MMHGLANVKNIVVFEANKFIIVFHFYNTKECPLQKMNIKKNYPVVPNRQSNSQPLDIHRMMKKIQKADTVCCRLCDVMVWRVMNT